MHSFLNELMNPEAASVPVSCLMGYKEPAAGVCCSTGRDEEETQTNLSHPHNLEQPVVRRSIYRGLGNGERGTDAGPTGSWADWEPESVGSSALKIV